MMASNPPQPALQPAFGLQINNSRQYLVKGWFAPGQTSVIYGTTNVGKTFFCVDLAFHVAHGLSWNGSRVKKGKVLYIATEGHGGFDRRIEALRRVKTIPEGVDPNDWLVLLGQINLHCPERTGALEQLIGDHEFDLVVIDTLAMALGSGSENENTTFNTVLRHLAIFRKNPKVHIILVHHPGKDTARGARGHSSLQAAVDTEVCLKSEDGLVCVEVTKQRDHGRQKKVFYALEEVVLGTDDEGDPLTSCVVRFVDRKSKSAVKLTDNDKRCLEALKRAAEWYGYSDEDNDLVSPETTLCAGSDWQRTVLEDEAFSQEATSRENKLRNFRRIQQKLLEKGLIGKFEDTYWLVDEERRVDEDQLTIAAQ